MLLGSTDQIRQQYSSQQRSLLAVQAKQWSDRTTRYAEQVGG